MSYFSAIFTIAVLIQVSHPTSHDDFDKFQKGVEGLYDVLKSLIPASEAMMQTTLEQIPTTANYKSYRNDIRKYLEDVENYKTVRGLCMEKTLRIVNHFKKLEQKYQEEDVEEEAKEVFKLFNENGREEIVTTLKVWAARYADDDVLAYLNDPHTIDAIRMLPMSLKAC